MSKRKVNPQPGGWQPTQEEVESVLNGERFGQLTVCRLLLIEVCVAT